MLTIVLAAVLIWIACKVFAFGIRVTWGIAKVLLPLFIVIGLIYRGLVYFAFPILVILGAVFLICHIIRA